MIGEPIIDAVRHTVFRVADPAEKVVERAQDTMCRCAVEFERHDGQSKTVCRLASQRKLLSREPRHHYSERESAPCRAQASTLAKPMQRRPDSPRLRRDNQRTGLNDDGRWRHGVAVGVRVGLASQPLAATPRQAMATNSGKSFFIPGLLAPIIAGKRSARCAWRPSLKRGGSHISPTGQMAMQVEQQP